MGVGATIVSRTTGLVIAGVGLVFGGIGLIAYGMYRGMGMSEAVSNGVILISLGLSALGLNKRMGSG